MTKKAIFDFLERERAMPARITVLETKLLSTGNLWARCPSGWLCVWEKDGNKKYIK